MQNLRRTLLALLSCALLAGPGTVLAQSSAAASQAAAVNSAKAAANETTQQVQKTGVKIDADGNMVRDANGNAVKTSAGQTPLEDQLRYFKNMTGLGNSEQLADPGRTGGRAGASTTMAGILDFSCKLTSRIGGAVSGLQVEFRGCIGTPAKVTGMHIGVCDRSLRGEACSDKDAAGKAIDYFEDLDLAEGQFISRKGIQYGLGCNAAATCRITVKGSFSLVADGDGLKKQATDARAAEGQSSYTAGLSKVINDPAYSTRIQSQGKDLQDCWNRNTGAGTTGSGVDCSKGASINQTIGQTGQQGAQCSDAPSCIRTSTSVKSFSRECTRTFPLTVKAQNVQLTSTLSCDIKRAAGAAIATSSSCDKPAGADVSWTDPKTGMTQVGQSTPICTATQGASDVCVTEALTEYYVDFRPGALKDLGFTTSPSQLSKANPVCDTNNGVAAFSSCESGQWFGRTLDAAECTSSDEGRVVNLAYPKKGCGVCLQPTLYSTCYGEPSANDEQDTCATTDLNAPGTTCKLKPQPDGIQVGSTSNLNGQGGAGLVISQKESYTCTSKVEACLEYAPLAAGCAPSGGGVNTFGLERAPTSNGSTGNYGNAVTQAAVVNGIAKGLQDSADVNFPRIFNGEDLRCERPLGGFLGGLLTKNCCRTDLQRPKKGNIIQQGCGDNEVKLAAARRANMAFYIGNQCTKKSPWPQKKCLREEQTYCAFKGTLAKTVQIEGRKQLADLTAHSADTSIQRATVSYYYYAEKGRWSEVSNVNGVAVAAWQYPGYCRTPETAAKQFAADPNASDCPNALQGWFAACDAAAGCGELPIHPTDGAAGWSIQPLDPLKDVTVAISRYATVNGACDPASEQCKYTVSAWPVTQGGKITVSRDLTFELFSSAAVLNTGSIRPTLGNVSDLMFRTYSSGSTIGSPLPGTVRIDFSKDGGTNWIRADVPTNDTNEFSVPTTDIKVVGHCDAATNLCSYRMTGTSTVTAKPWGSAQNPDCTGFTPGQLGALDFGKMDLSEWLNEVLSKSNATAGGFSATTAGSTIQAQLEVYGGKSPLDQDTSVSQISTRPSGSPVAIATPAEGYGPFDVMLRVGGRFPYDSRAPESGALVNSVSVDWGDCSAATQLDLVSSGPNGEPAHGFETTYVAGKVDHRHRYKAPNDPQHYKCGVGAENSVVHKIVISLYTSDGVKKVNLTVTNAWNSVTGKAGGNFGGPTGAASAVISKKP